MNKGFDKPTGSELWKIDVSRSFYRGANILRKGAVGPK
jgi:hypothetical protein